MHEDGGSQHAGQTGNMQREQGVPHHSIQTISILTGGSQTHSITGQAKRMRRREGEGGIAYPCCPTMFRPFPAHHGLAVIQARKLQWTLVSIKHRQENIKRLCQHWQAMLAWLLVSCWVFVSWPSMAGQEDWPLDGQGGDSRSLTRQ